jgi:hypothetical protein
MRGCRPSIRTACHGLAPDRPVGTAGFPWPSLATAVFTRNDLLFELRASPCVIPPLLRQALRSQNPTCTRPALAPRNGRGRASQRWNQCFTNSP